MRMKKLMILAVAAIALVACSRTFDTQHGTEAAIGFNTWTEHLTKAEARVQGTNNFLNGDTFKVYGYRTDGSGNHKVFDGDVVTCTDDSASPTVWEYTDLKFWDKNSTSYTFYAFSPSAVPVTSASTTYSDGYDGHFASSNITFNGKTNDILIACENVINNPADHPKVAMNFVHAASLIDVKVRKADVLENTEVKVTAISFSNIRTVGTFAVSAYAASSPWKPTIAWTPDATPTTANFATANTAGVTNATIPTADIAFWGDPHSATSGTELVNSFVAMPQDLNPDSNKQKLTFTYTIKVGDDTITYADNDVEFKAFDDGDNTTAGSPDNYIVEWEPGKHYTYYLTIGANAIEFTASVTNWTAVNGYHYLIN